MGSTARRRRVEPTDDWEQLALLCLWPEQRAYEEIRPLTLFGSSVAERASETGTPERTLYRRVGRFEAEGMEALFGSEGARRKRLPPAMRRLILDLKAEHPAFNPNEIANACYVRFGRRPDRKTVGRVLSEEPIPLRFVRRFAPYHEMPEGPERRMAAGRLRRSWASSRGYATARRS
jgi:transposase